MPAKPKPQKGQVWKDLDPRSPDPLFTIGHVGSTHVIVQRENRVSRISIERLLGPENERGYGYVGMSKDGDGVQDA